MAKKGDKYIIEISDVFYDTYMKTYYKIKGFNTLVFDEYGLEKLTKIIEQEHECECMGKSLDKLIKIIEEIKNEQR